MEIIGAVILVVALLLVFAIFSTAEQIKDNLTGKTAKDISKKEIVEKWRMVYFPEIERIKKELDEAERIKDINKIEILLDELENVSTKIWSLGLKEDSENVDTIIANYYEKYLKE